MATNSGRLRATLRLCTGSLFHAAERLYSHPELAQVYPEYLVTLHWLLRANVSLMECARAASADRYRRSAAHHALTAYLEQHIREETGHDQWVLEDLAVLDFSNAQVLSYPPSTTAASLVGAQYYWIEHCDPMALLGYIAIMEGYPIAVATVEQMQNKTELPPAAFRTLRVHAMLDETHRDDFDSFIDGLELSPGQFSLVVRSGLATIEGTATLLERLSQPHDALVSWAASGRGCFSICP